MGSVEQHLGGWQQVIVDAVVDGEAVGVRLLIEDTYQPRIPAAHTIGNEPSHKRPAVSHKPLRRARKDRRRRDAALCGSLSSCYHVGT
jgi:hypothetical protein